MYNNIIFLSINQDDEKYKILEQTVNTKFLKTRFGPIIYKFHAFTLKEYDRIVIMDADFLVKDDISELFYNDDIKFGATIDPYFKTNLDVFKNRDKEYFNVGIMSVSKQYLDGNIINDTIEIIKNDCLKQNNEVFTFKGDYPEQDLLNLIMFKKDVMLIPTKYNGNGSLKTDDYLTYSCIHFLTGNKPWKLGENYSNSFKVWHDYYNEVLNIIEQSE